MARHCEKLIIASLLTKLKGAHSLLRENICYNETNYIQQNPCKLASQNS